MTCHPINDLVADALKNRLEIEQARINLDSNQLNLVGIKNSLKPTLQVFAELTNNGLSGAGNVRRLSPAATEPLLGEIFRRDYPELLRRAVSLNIPLRNRAAQADYATSVIESGRTN